MAATLNAATFIGKNFMDNEEFHRSHLEENVRHHRESGGRTRRDQQCGQDSLRKTFMETTIIDWTEEVIREMDRLANEDHTHIATEEELNIYRGNWWIRSNFVGSDTMPIRHRPDFKESAVNLASLQESRG